ncbi:SIR2 family protein [Mesorhizobium sp. M7A.F.Ca.MR.245.00.0.0]|uniref:SIR2 family protein n=1 Tax=Mesorhizobium sp. M7A.F.Ca.MR.245.00.0.0 TaxID=2496778 RepID=UPI000FCCA429|nr:SIR2 family protein [Mesorhizobium sp. M7A.F.Ca.MR.245.00.0.0]RUV18890.1 SIR2 family protein [Mesorhizobium sp. M7A.F.Ca.MR.245.00.0.0]
MDGGEASVRTFAFLRNGEAEPSNMDWGKGIESARQAISEALNARNIAFLLGAGCSSLMRDGAELGIPTMAPLAKEFCGETIAAVAADFTETDLVEDDERVETGSEHFVRGEDGADVMLRPESAGDQVPDLDSKPVSWRLTKPEYEYLAVLGIDLESGYNRNLERLMEVLFSQRFLLRQSAKSSHWPQRDLIDNIIGKVQSFLWSHLTNGAFNNGDTEVRDLYERFYKKLVLRDRSLPRPWVFTTNYDVFNETAMDRLGIPYANGFSGIIERRFNPATFRYALAEQLDVGSRKWTAVDAFVYLCKLHGSVTWTEDDHGLFPIREAWPQHDPKRMLIYPTPAKQNASLASPYADLFREFQSRVVREQSVLITAGYAFGDEHINNIIYQALTIPTFRLVIFASPDTEGDIAKLRGLRDPRIWIIGGDGPVDGSRAHYFDTIVEHFMPQRPSDRIDEAVRKAILEMAPPAKDDGE